MKIASFLTRLAVLVTIIATISQANQKKSAANLTPVLVALGAAATISILTIFKKTK